MSRDRKYDQEQGVDESVKEDVYERKPVASSGTRLMLMAFSTLGIIYSDIGTSPLYVLNGIWPSSGPVPPPEDIIGGISAIVWSLLLIPTLKYVGFALQFGTGQGEGGPFALYTNLFPKHVESDSRSLTTYPTLGTASKPALKERFRWPLLAWAVFGTGLTLSDGILTPAVSVTSAVGGLAVVKPNVTSDVVGISIAFLVFLFGIQRFGTAKISFVFAPLTAIWLALLGATGIANIVQHPGIFRAFDPSRAILWFVRTKNYDALNGVLLAITGCEAMFANLGQFNAASIRISFVGFACPMLILAYLGQGARLIVDPSVLNNMFYMTIPGRNGGGLWWVVWLFGILATLIASQAMITATFSLVHQLMGMNAFPSLRVVHTSSSFQGQIYIAPINWLLMIATIAVVGGFGSSTALTLAYGFAVSTVLIVTTTLLSISIPSVKHFPWVLGLLFFLFFGFLEGLFWGAALKKVPEGAWFPLGLGSLLTILMVFWAWGRSREEDFESKHSHRLTEILATATSDTEINVGDTDSQGEKIETASDSLPPVQHDQAVSLRQPDGTLQSLPRTARLTVVHGSTPSGNGVPHAFAALLQGFPALPTIVVFLTCRVVAVPHVELSQRYTVNKVRSVEGFYTVTMRIGYLDHAAPVASDIATLLAGFAQPSQLDFELAVSNVTHVIPSYIFTSDPRATPNRAFRWVRQLLVEDVYARARVMFPDPVRVESNSQESLLRIAVRASI